MTNAKCEKEFCSSLALGASCTHMDDMTRAFAVFARNGKPSEPTFVRRVIDRNHAGLRRIERARLAPPAVLPHYPMVLHQGAFPDGS